MLSNFINKQEKNHPLQKFYVLLLNAYDDGIRQNSTAGVIFRVGLPSSYHINRERKRVGDVIVCLRKCDKNIIKKEKTK